MQKNWQENYPYEFSKSADAASRLLGSLMPPEYVENHITASIDTLRDVTDNPDNPNNSAIVPNPQHAAKSVLAMAAVWKEATGHEHPEAAGMAEQLREMKPVWISPTDVEERHAALEETMDRFGIKEDMLERSPKYESAMEKRAAREYAKSQDEVTQSWREDIRVGKQFPSAEFREMLFGWDSTVSPEMKALQKQWSGPFERLVKALQKLAGKKPLTEQDKKIIIEIGDWLPSRFIDGLRTDADYNFKRSKKFASGEIPATDPVQTPYYGKEPMFVELEKISINTKDATEKSDTCAWHAREEAMMGITLVRLRDGWDNPHTGEHIPGIKEIAAMLQQEVTASLKK